MTNPTPRPALRKADDADVHPAAPRPTRSPRSRTSPRSDAPSTETAPAAVAALPSPDDKPAEKPVETSAEKPAERPAAKKAPAKPRSAAPATPSKRRERKFSGNTSDHMRVAETVEAVEVTPPQKPKAPKAPAPVAVPAPPVPAAAPAPKVVASPDASLLKGKTVELEVHVPKALRKAARAEAKKRGLDIDTVVIDLLHAWLTDRR